MRGLPSRGEYWKFIFFSIVLIIIDVSASAKFGHDSVALLFATTVFNLFFLGGSIYIIIRRLHDI
ncbi:DUF805 domain-containing protein [Klebsiella oxytoca]|nr:DUF805 domain-containing protein [Klebsiella oxytoca]